jgi:hypothetical protein
MQRRARHRGTDLGDRGGDRRLGSAVDDDARPLAREAGGDGVADALAGAGDDGELVAELEIHGGSILCEPVAAPPQPRSALPWGVAMLPRKPSASHLARRLAKNAAVVAGLLAAALAIGAIGYHYLDGLPWLDATLNAAMILTGMGPVDRLVSPSAKVFAIVYALFGGVFFLSMVAVLLAPVAQHLLHRFHLELDEHREERRRREH